MPYRNLAKLTSLSSVAVHKRVLELVKQGIINRFQAEIDIRAIKGTSIMVFGRTESSSPSQLYNSLAENDCTSMVLLGSGDYFYIGTMLRISLPTGVVHRFRSGRRADAAGRCRNPHDTAFGRAYGRHPDPSEISPLEVRMISALRNDARKRTTDVAKELGVTARPSLPSSRR